MLEQNLLNKGNNTPSEEGSRVNIAELAKETGAKEEFLKAKLTGEETHAEALKKIVKADFEAEQKITEQGQLLAQKTDELRSFTQRTLNDDGDKKGDGAGGIPRSQLNKVDEIVAILKDSKKTKEEIEASKKELKKLQEEIQFTREQNKDTTNQVLGQLRQRQYEEGYNQLETRLGPEIAKKYFDKQNPDKTPIGQILSGTLSDEKQRAWAKGVKSSAMLTENPIEFIFRNLASPEDFNAYFGANIPHTEAPGVKAKTGGTLQDKVISDAAKFMNIKIKEEE